jgi:hypothetical protein
MSASKEDRSLRGGQEREKMLEAGFIRPCRYAEWISSNVPVQKKGDRW